MKKIVAVSGSLRTDSYNTNLLNKLSNIFKDEVEYEILDISSVPLFNEDIENDKNKYIDSLKNKIKNSDFVIISTPEYNYSVSGVLKNALDWFSRGENPVFENKDVGILSASPSKFGGVRAQMHLRQILLCLKANVLNKQEVFISSAHETIDNDETKKYLIKFANIILDKLKEK